MPPLDNTRNISPDFNTESYITEKDKDIERRLGAHQLTPNEREEVFNARKEHSEARQQELKSFRDPEQRVARIEDKVKELRASQKPAIGLQPAGFRAIPSEAEMLNHARDLVQRDHKQKLGEIDQRYEKKAENVMQRAAEQGRGPQEKQQDKQHEPQRDHTKEINLTRDFNDRAR